MISDIVIYGGTFSGVSAARMAALSSNKKIALIVPDSNLGGIGTAGGQNFFDIRRWNNDLVTKGSFDLWFNNQGQIYNTQKMSDFMKAELEKYKNIQILYGYDIIDYTTSFAPYTIGSITIESLIKDEKGILKYGTMIRQIKGKVFIDASDDGKMTRIINFGGTTGRQDWPKNKLENDEKSFARQQVATLMFKAKGIDINNNNADMKWGKTSNNIYYCYGGWKTAQSSIIKNFNNTYGPKGYAIKPLNAGQDGENSEEWWINSLLRFNVDGRVHERDKINKLNPKMRSDYINTDEALLDTKEFLKTESFLKAFKQFPGFEDCELVKDNDGNIITGEVMYIRETVHSAKSSKKCKNGTENNNYVITTKSCLNAGINEKTGSDKKFYKTRIGLNYYWMDVNGYQYKTKTNENGEIERISEDTKDIRNDLKLKGGAPENPVYIPYKALTTKYVSNLINCGYGINASSMAWAEIRVIPNLCVLGDAAGIIGALSIEKNIAPLYFKKKEIKDVQNKLKELGARIDK